MASTLRQKTLTIYCQIAKNDVHFELYDVQISPAFGPNTYQIMYGETRLSMSASAMVT